MPVGICEREDRFDRGLETDRGLDLHVLEIHFRSVTKCGLDFLLILLGE